MSMLSRLGDSLLVRAGLGTLSDPDTEKAARALGYFGLAAALFLVLEFALSFTSLLYFTNSPPAAIQILVFAVGVATYLSLLGMFLTLYLYALGKTRRRSLRLLGHVGALLGMILTPVLLVVSVVNRVVTHGYGRPPEYVFALNSLTGLGQQLALILVSVCALGALSGFWKALPFLVPLSFSPLLSVPLILVIGAVYNTGLWVPEIAFSGPPLIGALANSLLGYSMLRSTSSGSSRGARGRVRRAS